MKAYLTLLAQLNQIGRVNQFRVRSRFWLSGFWTGSLFTVAVVSVVWMVGKG